MALQSQLVIIAGPNGAGKSTLARLLLPAPLPFLNADQIAETLPDSPTESRDRQAARLLLERWDILTARRRSFAVETTLASRTLVPRLRQLRADGWRIHLVFVSSPSPELNVARVACRVRAGGHDIPEAVIYRRFESGRKNLRELYLPLAHRWMVFSNAYVTGPEPIETGGDSGDSVFDDPTEVLRRFQIAVREAVCDHQRVGNPVAVWRAGSVVILSPDKIELAPTQTT